MGYSTVSRLEAEPGGCVCDLSSTLMADSKPLRIQGYATRFNIVGGPYKGRGIIIHPDAFKEVNLRDPEIKCLLGHDDSWVLGSVSGGNLRFDIRPLGLWMTCDLIDSPIGRHVYELVKRRDMTNQSIAFRHTATDAKRVKDEEGNEVEIIGAATELIETSIVAWGVFKTTTAEIVDPGPSRPARVPVQAPVPTPAPIPSIAAGDSRGLDHYRKRFDSLRAGDLERHRRFLREVEAKEFEEQKARVRRLYYAGY